MRVTTMCLADYANQTIEGKLNVLGMFGVIHSKKFPCVHRNAYLVINLLAETQDHMPQAADQIPCEITIVNPDGKLLLKVDVPIPIVADRDQFSFMFALNDLPLESPGDYEIKVKAGDKEPEVLPFAAVKRA